jgi:predicted membrane protein (TIGR00267 family)
MSRLRHLRTAVEDPETRALARRYFVSNGFDGTLTSVGASVGAVLSGVESGTVVVKIAVGAAVGLATSGLWSVYEIERSEMRARQRRVESAMLTDLSGTRVARRNRWTRIVTAVASGFGPVVGVLLPVSPFLFTRPGFGLPAATVAAVAVATGLLFTFGAYLGSRAGQNWLVAGARMGLAGVVVAVLNLLLPG